MRSGFTLIEVLVTVAILLTLGVVVVVSLQGAKNNDDVTGTAREIAALLRQAQSDAMSQEQNASWGVYFSNATNTAPFYALFINSYATSTIHGQYRLPSTVRYQSSFLPSGATTSIIFAQITGAASVSTTIGLYLMANAAFSSTIPVALSGAVAY